MFWGGICLENIKELLPVQQELMDSGFYLQNILEQYTQRFIYRKYFILMQGNEVTVPVLDWSLTISSNIFKIR